MEIFCHTGEKYSKKGRNYLPLNILFYGTSLKGKPLPTDRGGTEFAQRDSHELNASIIGYCLMS
jgi:hypothetical protein